MYLHAQGLGGRVNSVLHCPKHVPSMVHVRPHGFSQQPYDVGTVILN